jgi:hypothetical protein
MDDKPALSSFPLYDYKSADRIVKQTDMFVLPLQLQNYLHIPRSQDN